MEPTTSSIYAAFYSTIFIRGSRHLNAACLSSVRAILAAALRAGCSICRKETAIWNFCFRSLFAGSLRAACIRFFDSDAGVRAADRRLFLNGFRGRSFSTAKRSRYAMAALLASLKRIRA